MRSNIPVVGTVLSSHNIIPYGVISPSEDLDNVAGYKIQDQGVRNFFSYRYDTVPGPTEVWLVQFASMRVNGHIYLPEILDWGKMRNRIPFFPEHLCGLLFRHPEPKHPTTKSILRIVALGREEKGLVLCVWGKDNFKGVSTLYASGSWGGVGSEAYTFGFVPAQAHFESVDIPSALSGPSRISS